MATGPKPCSLVSCPKCGFSMDHAIRATWSGPVYKPGMDVGTCGSRGDRLGERLAYTCNGCGFTHEDPILSKD